MKTKMKLLAFGVLLLLSVKCTITMAQENPTFTKWYLQGSTGVASKRGICAEVGLQGIIKNKWALGISYQNILSDPKNLPGDYQGDVIIIFPIDLTPNAELSVVNITAGRYFETGRKTWFTTEAGITLGSCEKYTFSKTEPQFFIIGVTANYVDHSEKASLAGAILQTDFNWAFGRRIGMGADVFANINSVQSSVGLQLKLLIGNLRPRLVLRDSLN